MKAFESFGVLKYFASMFILIVSGCNYRELPDNLAPIRVDGRVMLDANTPAANIELEFFQTHKNGEENWERRSHGSTTTNSDGSFNFRYARNNEVGGGKKCFFLCNESCRGLEIEVDGEVISRCMPTNRQLEVELYLDSSMILDFRCDNQIGEGDTIFVNVAPTDTSHPNYYIQMVNGRIYEALAIPGPIGDQGIELVYRTTMNRAQYQGLNNQLRGPSYIVWSQNFENYALGVDEIEIAEELGPDNRTLNDVRFRGEPFIDTLRLPSCCPAQR